MSSRHDRKRRYSEDRDDHDRRRSRKRHYEWGRRDRSPPTATKEKEKPNHETTGKLTEETNTFRGAAIRYTEPPEARIPKRRWRLHPFKGEKALPILPIHRQSVYLIGRDKKTADLAVDHPSCSKQHAAFQFRMVPHETETGKTIRVRPFIIDLGSTNGTHLNGKRIRAQKYHELFEMDVLKFGYSTREYVLLHENSDDAAEDDDIA